MHLFNRISLVLQHPLKRYSLQVEAFNPQDMLGIGLVFFVGMFYNVFNATEYRGIQALCSSLQNHIMRTFQFSIRLQ